MPSTSPASSKGSRGEARKPVCPAVRSKVVTLGGGHGQATLLAALRRLEVEVSAIVSVADDGGCSGQLRRDSGMPPPGDLRRCLAALSTRPRLATLFEERLPTAHGVARCAGNLVLAAKYEELGSMQAAVDWARELLGCEGRVLPASETPGEILVCDAQGQVCKGESRIEAAQSSPVVIGVHGAGAGNPAALAAIAEADYLLFGPGSFFTSVLAVVGTPGMARACISSAARSFFIANLCAEGAQTADWPLERYARILKDHLTIDSLGEAPSLGVLAHTDEVEAAAVLPDGTPVWVARLAAGGAGTHDPELLAMAFAGWFGFERRPCVAGQSSVEALETRTGGEDLFGEALGMALERYVPEFRRRASV